MKRAIALLAAALCFQGALMAQKQEGFTTHIVKWFEDINSISASYGVPVDVLVKVNNLPKPEVNNRQKIRIPVSEKYWPVTSGLAVDGETQETVAAAPAAAQAEETPLSAATAGTVATAGVATAGAAEVAVADPTTPETADTAEAADSVQTAILAAIPSDKISLGLMLQLGSGSETQKNNSLDFYSGILMAVSREARSGMKVTLDVIDISRDFSRAELAHDDLVIGPFRYADYSAELGADNEMRDKMLISPLDPRTASLAMNNPLAVQMPSLQGEMFDSIISWEDGDNYIIISSEDDDKTLREAKAALDARGIEYKTCLCSVQGEVEGWEEAYKEEGVNKVILAINSEAPLNNAIRNMCIEESKGNVLCYALSKATSYESIPVENIHRAHLHVLSAYYIDYSDPYTLDFIHQFRALFGCEPSQYAFQGYDIATFLIRTYREYGQGWKDHVCEAPQMDLLQSSFKLKRMENGGLVNTAVRRLEYLKDYKVNLIR